MSPFFGLTPEYKLGLHKEIFSVCYAGKGGFTFNEVYGMPIHLRRYYIKMIIDTIDEEKKQYENTSGKQISKPNINIGR
jgi:hypothetical protein